jgi:hypothetical protein
MQYNSLVKYWVGLSKAELPKGFCSDGPRLFLCCFGGQPVARAVFRCLRITSHPDANRHRAVVTRSGRKSKSVP